jgi:hypothetical protein
MKTYLGVHAFLNSAVDVGEWSASRSGCLTYAATPPPPRTPWVGGWGGVRVGGDEKEISIPAGSRTPVVQPVT